MDSGVDRGLNWASSCVIIHHLLTLRLDFPFFLLLLLLLPSTISRCFSLISIGISRVIKIMGNKTFLAAIHHGDWEEDSSCFKYILRPTRCLAKPHSAITLKRMFPRLGQQTVLATNVCDPQSDGYKVGECGCTSRRFIAFRETLPPPPPSQRTIRVQLPF